MADNVTVDNGGLTDFTFASDDNAGVQYQYIKVMDGTANAFTNVMKVDSFGALFAGHGKTLLHAVISTATSGDQTIVAADASNKIKVYAYTLVTDGTVTITWKRGTTAISGAMGLPTSAGLVVNVDPPGTVLETAANEALILNLSASIGVRGHVSYFKEA